MILHHFMYMIPANNPLNYPSYGLTFATFVMHNLSRYVPIILDRQ